MENVGNEKNEGNVELVEVTTRETTRKQTPRLTLASVCTALTWAQEAEAMFRAIVRGNPGIQTVEIGDQLVDFVSDGRDDVESKTAARLLLETVSVLLIHGKESIVYLVAFIMAFSDFRNRELRSELEKR